MRFVTLLLIGLFSGAAFAQDKPAGDFSAFIAKLWPDAQAKGITRATFDTALRGVTPDQRVIAATQRQPEYGKPVGDYVNAIVSKRRIADAQLKGREWAKTFDVVEKKFQVERGAGRGCESICGCGCGWISDRGGDGKA